MVHHHFREKEGQNRFYYISTNLALSNELGHNIIEIESKSLIRIECTRKVTDDIQFGLNVVWYTHLTQLTHRKHADKRKTVTVAANSSYPFLAVRLLWIRCGQSKRVLETKSNNELHIIRVQKADAPIIVVMHIVYPELVYAVRMFKQWMCVLVFDCPAILFVWFNSFQMKQTAIVHGAIKHRTCESLKAASIVSQIQRGVWLNYNWIK